MAAMAGILALFSATVSLLFVRACLCRTAACGCSVHLDRTMAPGTPGRVLQHPSGSFFSRDDALQEAHLSGDSCRPVLWVPVTSALFHKDAGTDSSDFVVLWYRLSSTLFVPVWPLVLHRASRRAWT